MEERYRLNQTITDVPYLWDRQQAGGEHLKGFKERLALEEKIVRHCKHRSSRVELSGKKGQQRNTAGRHWKGVITWGGVWESGKDTLLGTEDPRGESDRKTEKVRRTVLFVSWAGGSFLF